MNDDTKAAIVVGALVAGAVGLLAFFSHRGRRARRRAIGDGGSRGVLEVAADAFMEGDIKRGEEVLAELPEKQRLIARCTRARKKRYEKGDGWKSTKQISTYQLYRPFVADPLHGTEPKQHPYTKVTVNAMRTTDLEDGNVSDWIAVIGELGPTKRFPDPEGEHRMLVSEQTRKASHRDVLYRLGYDVVVPCGNVPLS